MGKHSALMDNGDNLPTTASLTHLWIMLWANETHVHKDYKSFKDQFIYDCSFLYIMTSNSNKYVQRS